MPSTLRVRAVVAGLTTTILATGAALAFYAAVLNGGSGTVTTQPFGANP